MCGESAPADGHIVTVFCKNDFEEDVITRAAIGFGPADNAIGIGGDEQCVCAPCAVLRSAAGDDITVAADAFFQIIGCLLSIVSNDGLEAAFFASLGNGMNA